MVALDKIGKRFAKPLAHHNRHPFEQPAQLRIEPRCDARSSGSFAALRTRDGFWTRAIMPTRVSEIRFIYGASIGTEASTTCFRGASVTFDLTHAPLGGPLSVLFYMEEMARRRGVR